MDQLGRVNVVDSFQDLIENVNLMHFLKNIGSDDRMKIRLHILEYQVQIFIISGFHDLVKLDNVIMFQSMKHFNLSVGSLRID